ncbi:MAG: Gfo/Idh/MocA family oxidoreductase [Clostridia bacterium]|nr:Gfo/Idh/MocA family oxidoreductase [Clostridia bacterium]
MNIGLLGFGSMGRTHSWAVDNIKFYYKDLPFEAKIKGVYTRTPETRESAAKRFGFDIAAASEDELINNDDIDIIDICTPNTSHYETLKKAINAGKHVYCEKPLCVTSAQAYEIAELADKRGVVGKIVFNNRYMSAMLSAKKLVDEGRLGRILSFRCTYLHSSCTDLNKSAGWKQNRDICGGGVLFDLGSHAIDLVYHICGRFKEVNGRAQIAFATRPGMDGKLWQTNADEAFYMIAELECGAVGTIEASKIAVGANDDLTLEVYGTDGSIRFNLMEPNYLYFYDNTKPGGDFGGERGFTKIECVSRYASPAGIFPGIKAPTGWLRGHLGSMYDFLDAVHRRDRQSHPNFSDASHVQRVMEAGYESSETGRPVKII